jgi:hypothetical protein
MPDDSLVPDARRRIAQHVTLAGFESEFRGELPDDVADRISPDLWPLHLLGGGHWLLETHLDEVVPLVEDFLSHLGESNS